MAIKRAIFYAYSKGKVAYRLFPSENSEALPNTTMPSNIDFFKIDKSVLKELGYPIYADRVLCYIR
jgi:hypothetical protein